MNTPLRPSSGSPQHPGAVRAMAHRNERHFKRGSLMFIQGDAGAEMFILRSGKVRILKQEGENCIELAVLGPGAVLGELSLLDHQARSATAQVVEDLAATIVDEAALTATLKAIPSWLENVIQLVVKRLRDTMAKNEREVVEKSVGGVLRIITVLNGSKGYETDGERRILLSDIKNAVHDIIGIGDVETENVFLHLILKNLILIHKTENGAEYLVLRDIEALKLYMNYLRAHQRNAKYPGEDLSAGALELVGFIVEAGKKNGRRIKDSIVRIGLQQVSLELARSGKSKDVSLDALDELIAIKAIAEDTASTASAHGVHKFEVLIYNEESLGRLRILQRWLPTFREDIRF
jgi:CRP-like cAMP-binding protein